LRIVIDGRYINDAFPGIGRYTFNLIASLAELGTGDALLVLVNTRLPNRRYDFNRLAALPGCEIVECAVDRFLPSELLRLAPVVRALHPDLFHSPFYLRPFPLATPCVHTIHDLIPLRFPRGHTRVQRMMFGMGVRVACRMGAAILTLSELSARELRRLCPGASRRIFVTPLAADPCFRLLPPGEAENILHSLDLAGCRYVLHVSSGLHHKNIDLLLRAWDRHMRNHPEDQRRLVLAGNYGRRQAPLAALADSLPARSSIVFSGAVDETALVALYNGAELFVFPSSMEGFGLPVVEAMACGAPVLTTDRVGLAADLGNAAWLVPADELDPLVDALEGILAIQELRRSLSARGLAFTQSRSRQATAQLTWNVYRNVVGLGEK
jgi:glycosyltransferase involved in cell wall biosynthesis